MTEYFGSLLRDLSSLGWSASACEIPFGSSLEEASQIPSEYLPKALRFWKEKGETERNGKKGEGA